MTQHVTKDYVEIRKNYYNLSFIIPKNHGHKEPWTFFFRRTPWDMELKIPKSFFVLDLGLLGKHVFHPCAPFDIEKDECAAWLQWAITKPTEVGGEEIKMLKFVNNPKETFDDREIGTAISTHPDCQLWAHQLSQDNPPLLGIMTRMEDAVSKSINLGLRPLSNMIGNKIQREMQNFYHRQNRDYSPEPRRSTRRNESPDQRKPYRRNRSQEHETSSRRGNSPAPSSGINQLATQPFPQHPTQQMQTQQLQPTMAYPQMYNPQQIPLTPQQMQWNAGITSAMSTQPQPGLLYNPRMN